MSNLGNAMGRLFGGDDAPFLERLADLKREHGTVTGLARALGVDRRTIQRWESGKTRAPKPSTSKKVDVAYRGAQAQKRTLPGDDSVRIGFTQHKKGGGERHRSVSGDQLGLDEGTMGRARDAFILGGEEAAAAKFVDGITDDWYHDLFDDDLTGEGELPDDSVSDPSPTSVSIR